MSNTQFSYQNHSDYSENLIDEGFVCVIEEARREFEEINPHPEIQAKHLREAMKELPSVEFTSSAKTILWFVKWFCEKEES